MYFKLRIIKDHAFSSGSAHINIKINNYSYIFNLPSNIERY